MKRRLVLWGGAALGILVLVVAPFTFLHQAYLVHIGIMALYYAILASSWSLLAGYAGQFSFGHMAFMAIGAYTTGLIGKFVRLASAPTGTCTEFPLGGWYLVLQNATGPNCLEAGMAQMPPGSLIVQPPILVGILAGTLLGGIFGWLIGVLVLRLRRTYLALFTIGFSEILRVAINAEIDITDGPNGLELDPLFPNGLTLFGRYFEPTDKLPPYFLMLGLFVVSMGLMSWLASSRFGLFIRAIREDQEAAAALGVHVVRYKVLVFVVTSMIAAAAGAVQAHYIGVITPNILLILQMSLVISMAVIGGLESLVGAAIGAILIQFALEFLRRSFTIGTITVDMTTWRLVFFGILLMLTLRFQRNGLIHPLLERITRAEALRETVAKRQAPAEV